MKGQKKKNEQTPSNYSRERNADSQYAKIRRLINKEKDKTPLDQEDLPEDTTDSDDSDN
ncbi:hypothetical protein [Xanthocytophaga agilis]|uniref:Uncharacterized protein n=1 Tax=Xanthocytophaga agilis TaxID=3048010 RepID=A0AAE3R5R0_9BACT|nr:hypothetical protein [Xanthocytophaga agilis]MDJ1504269.1 hypothetical protein [Xanthocytophaga agilis]